MEKLDNALIEAAFDLGAGPIRAFSKVIIPLTNPGIIAGTLLVFIPSIGMFAITDLMGGARVKMIGNAIRTSLLARRATGRSDRRSESHCSPCLPSRFG